MLNASFLFLRLPAYYKGAHTEIRQQKRKRENERKKRDKQRERGGR